MARVPADQYDRIVKYTDEKGREIGMPVSLNAAVSFLLEVGLQNCGSYRRTLERGATPEEA